MLAGAKKDDLKDPSFGLEEIDPRLRRIREGGLSAHEEYEELKRVLGSKERIPIPKAPPRGSVDVI